MMWSGEIFFRSLERSRSGRRPSTAIYAIVIIRRSRFTRSYYFADRDSRDRVISSITIYVIVLFLVGPGFEPWPNSTIFFIGPGFDSQARLPVSGQCDSWPMSEVDIFPLLYLSEFRHRCMPTLRRSVRSRLYCAHPLYSTLSYCTHQGNSSYSIIIFHY